MGLSEDLTLIKSKNKGQGLPFAIVGHKELVDSNEIFSPTLRDFHVIFWFKKGKGKYFIDFKEYEFRANTLVLISKDYLHYFEQFTGECEIQSIVFSPTYLYRNDSDLKHLFKFNAGCHFEGIQVLDLNKSDQQFLEQVSNQMKGVFSSWKGEVQGDAFYHLLCLFLLKCEQLQLSDESEIKIDGHSKTLNEFNQLLEQNFRKEFKVEFYSDHMGLTIKTLARLIKDQYRMSTKAYIDERRVLEIKRLLRGTTKSIKEIAYDLGFDEPTNLVKYFKKHQGVTPLEFRNSSN